MVYIKIWEKGGDLSLPEMSKPKLSSRSGSPSSSSRSQPAKSAPLSPPVKHREKIYLRTPAIRETELVSF
jgi:hypothetical protein